MATSPSDSSASIPATTASPGTPTLATPTTTSTPATSTTPASSSTTSSSNAASSASAASSAASSSRSSSAATSSSSSSAITTSSPTTDLAATSSGGSLQTITSFVTPTAATTSPSTSHSSNSFFSNKGAVAGVFTVVGLIVVALVIALVINAIRRRRAQKFDRDVAEAAAEAAAASHSPFDDYSYPNAGGHDSGGYGYSDNSHGTYQLPALSPQNEAYGMSEMSQYDPYAPGAVLLAETAVDRSRSRKDSEPRTPGIAGVGAGTLAREPSKRAPYHAFAGPGAQSLELQNVGRGQRRSQRAVNQDVLEAAGLVDAGATAAGAAVTRKPSEITQTTVVSRSQYGSVSSASHYQTQTQTQTQSQSQTHTQWQSAYPVDSYYPQRNDSHTADPFAGYPPVASPPEALPNPYEAPLAPPGIQSDPDEGHPPLSSPPAIKVDEQRISYQDDTDYSQGNRILRVANE